MAEDVKTGALEKASVTAMERPTWMPQTATGLEGMDEKDVQIPRLGIAQGLSPELDESKAEYIEGLKNGQMFNNLTKEIYGRGPFLFTVVQRYKPRYVEFIPRNQGGGIRDFDVPFDDPRTQFTKNEKGESVPPVATKFLDYVILLYREGKPPEMLALSFKSTGLKTARRLNGLMQAKMADIFAGVYSMKVVSQTNAKGTFNSLQIDNAGFQPTEEAYKFAKARHESLKGVKVKFDREPGDEEAEDATSFDTTEM